MRILIVEADECRRATLRQDARTWPGSVFSVVERVELQSTAIPREALATLEPARIHRQRIVGVQDPVRVEMLRPALFRTHRNGTRVAKLLGVTRQVVQRRMDRPGLSRADRSRTSA